MESTSQLICHSKAWEWACWVGVVEVCLQIRRVFYVQISDIKKELAQNNHSKCWSRGLWCCAKDKGARRACWLWKLPILWNSSLRWVCICHYEFFRATSFKTFFSLNFLLGIGAFRYTDPILNIIILRCLIKAGWNTCFIFIDSGYFVRGWAFWTTSKIFV